MKKILSAFAFAAIAIPSMALAAPNEDTATAEGSVTILRPITITKTADLSFGRIVKPRDGGAAVIIKSGDDSVNVDGDAYALPGVATSRAKFTIEGEGGANVSVSVPSSFTLVSDVDGKIEVDLESDLGKSTTLSDKPGYGGSADVNVGGVFKIASDTPTGFYRGEFSVVAAYE